MGTIDYLLVYLSGGLLLFLHVHVAPQGDQDWLGWWLLPSDVFIFVNQGKNGDNELVPSLPAISQVVFMLSQTARATLIPQKYYLHPP